jgi:hypothetical protein
MRTSPRSRSKQGFGIGKDDYTQPDKHLASYISNSSPLRPVTNNHPGTRPNHSDDERMTDLSSKVSSRAVSEAASEIVVLGDDEMDIDEPSFSNSVSESVDTPQPGYVPALPSFFAFLISPHAPGGPRGQASVLSSLGLHSDWRAVHRGLSWRRRSPPALT